MRRLSSILIFLLVSFQALSQQNLVLPKIERGEIIISHTGHTLSYDPAAMLPRWVAYELTSSNMDGNAERARSFSPDPDKRLKAFKLAEHWHYTHSGWVRGHMAPAGDFKFSQEAMNDTFYTTNICPMDMTFNNGIWKRLEEKIRKLAIEFGHLYIITGPILGTAKNGKVGESDILIPDAFFKAILVPYRDSYLSIGFILPNEPAPKGSKLKDYAMSVNEVESVIGMNLFYNLDFITAFKIEKQLPLKELGLY